MNPFGHQKDDRGSRTPTQRRPIRIPPDEAYEHTPGLLVEITLQGKIEFGHEADIAQRGAHHLFDFVRVHVCPRVVVVAVHATPLIGCPARIRAECLRCQSTEGLPVKHRCEPSEVAGGILPLSAKRGGRLDDAA